MISVLIADNQTLTREGVKKMLADMVDVDVVATAAYPAELELLLIKHKPKVLIIDPNYDQHFTVADIRDIRLRYDSVRLLILSNRQGRDSVNELIDLGVRNYIFKECGREELVGAVYSAGKGEQFFCKNTFETLFGNKLLPERDTALPQLSLRETELIHLIADGLTNKEIAEKLFLSVHTIKTHRKNMIKKLGFTFKNTAELSLLLQKK